MKFITATQREPKNVCAMGPGHCTHLEKILITMKFITEAIHSLYRRGSYGNPDERQTQQAVHVSRK